MPAPLSRLADRVEHPAGTALGLAAYVEARMERQRRMFDTVDTFYALTDAARRILLRNGAPERKVRVNRLGIDTYSLGPQVPLGARVRRAAQSLTVGYLGRFDPIKGLDDLLRAVTSLDSDVPVALDIRGVGDGRDAERVRKRCEAAARKDSRIRVGAAVPREGVRDLLQSWDLLCCPGVSLEGGPTVALEAMAVGTPVIGTRLGGLAEVLQDDRNGKLVTPNDWRALAGIIRAAALDTSIVERWRTHLPRVRTMCDVTADYVTAYRE
jgi:glycosyltransferase involved in cell wall biosynthesis